MFSYIYLLAGLLDHDLVAWWGGRSMVNSYLDLVAGWCDDAGLAAERRRVGDGVVG